MSNLDSFSQISENEVPSSPTDEQSIRHPSVMVPNSKRSLLQKHTKTCYLMSTTLGKLHSMGLDSVSSTNVSSNFPSSGRNGCLGQKKKPKSQLPSNLLNSRLEIAREPGFFGLVGLSALLSEQIVQPGTIWLQLLATAAEHQSEVQPSGGVSDGSDLIADVRLCILAHLLVEIGVGK